MGIGFDMGRDENSWQWAQTKLLEGERVRWKHWGRDSWIEVNDDGSVARFNKFENRTVYMGNFRLSADKMTEAGWSLYTESPEAVRNEILFRKFR